MPSGEEPSAEGEAASGGTPQESPAEGAEAEPEKTKESSEPATADGVSKPDDSGNNGTDYCITCVSLRLTDDRRGFSRM